MQQPPAVFGLGNVLLHDDAFGPQVISELRSRWIIADEVVVEDIGTPGLELSTFLAGHERIILVDAVAGGGPPGTIHSYDRDAIVRHPTGIRLGPHDPSLGETLLTLQLMDDGPREVLLLGAVPASTEPGIGLCEPVRVAASRVADMIIEMLRSEGCRVEARANPVQRIAWWETSTEFEAFRVAGNAVPD
ncbi:MAG: hydrogenase maturation protease [Thermoanaerobaculia bacterium]|jgi:hydrogenase maturation protease